MMTFQKSILKAMENLLSEQDKKMLKDIYSPKIVAVPDEDAYYNACVTREGYIRFYGKYNKKNVFDTQAPSCYIESRDCGLSWKRYIVDDQNAVGASTYVPFLDKFIKVKKFGNDTVCLIGNSPDDTSPERVIITSDPSIFEYRLPFIMTSKNRIIVICHTTRKEQHESAFYPVLLISDDAKEWTIIKMDSVPYAELKWPHKGYRWQQNNREATIAELSDGGLLLLSRTALDFHYTSKSLDGGLTWSEFEPSPFHSTATMPVLKKLSDGRLLFFWCNTKPLPELQAADGIWEDFFTNRDANHCCISEDDGKTFFGFRELLLNEIRNAPDFRSNGGPECSRDKSVHQFEPIELPMNKMLVFCGQHYASRRAIIFDLDWLYEKSRSENFVHGLFNLSTHSYVKSLPGGHPATSPENALEYVGHCAYNRVSGALLLPSPENNKKEALHIASSTDKRLISPICGAVWNFPIAKKGVLRLSLHFPENSSGLRVSLCDHWMNPSDDTVSYFASYSIVLRKDMVNDDKLFTQFEIEFSCDSEYVTACAGDYFSHTKRLDFKPPFGLCYLHMQSVDKNDTAGAFVSSIEFNAL